MGGNGFKYLKLVETYLHEEAKAAKKDIKSHEWNLEACQTCPVQSNTVDCGVFLIMNADFLSKNLPAVYEQRHISTCRKRIVLNILGTIPAPAEIVDSDDDDLQLLGPRKKKKKGLGRLRKGGWSEEQVYFPFF